MVNMPITLNENLKIITDGRKELLKNRTGRVCAINKHHFTVDFGGYKEAYTASDLLVQDNYEFSKRVNGAWQRIAIEKSRG